MFHPCSPFPFRAIWDREVSCEQKRDTITSIIFIKCFILVRSGIRNTRSPPYPITNQQKWWGLVIPAHQHEWALVGQLFWLKLYYACLTCLHLLPRVKYFPSLLLTDILSVRYFLANLWLQCAACIVSSCVNNLYIAIKSSFDSAYFI